MQLCQQHEPGIHYENISALRTCFPALLAHLAACQLSGGAELRDVAGDGEDLKKHGERVSYYSLKLLSRLRSQLLLLQYSIQLATYARKKEEVDLNAIQRRVAAGALRGQRVARAARCKSCTLQVQSVAKAARCKSGTLQVQRVARDAP